MMVSHWPQVERLAGSAVAGLQVVGRGDGPAALACVEHLRAIERNGEGVHIVQDDSVLRFSSVKRQTARMPGTIVFAVRSGPPANLRRVEHAGFAGCDAGVIARRNRQRQDAVADPVEIDFDFGGLVLVCIFVGVLCPCRDLSFRLSCPCRRICRPSSASCRSSAFSGWSFFSSLTFSSSLSGGIGEAPSLARTTT